MSISSQLFSLYMLTLQIAEFFEKINESVKEMYGFK